MRNLLLEIYPLVTSGVLQSEDIEWAVETKSIEKLTSFKKLDFYQNLDTSKHDDFITRKLNERIDFLGQTLKDSINPWLRYTFLKTVNKELVLPHQITLTEHIKRGCWRETEVVFYLEIYSDGKFTTG
jgi:hypothetical protein